MADNVPVVLGVATFTAATDKVTYSGDPADVQLVRVVGVSGAEGSKTVIDPPVSATDGIRVDVSPSSGIGSLTEVAPATDTASSGLNGRLQRIAQGLTSLIALLPTALVNGYFKITPGDAGGTAVTDTTAHAIKTLAVDATGAAVSTAVVATVDAITAKIATDSIQNGLTALTPKFVAIAAASSGNNTLLAAVSSKKIRVLAYNFIANGTVNGKFQSGASGTDLTGLKYCVANSGLCAPFNPVGWFETASNTLLNLNLSGAVAVGGELVYVEV